MTDYNLAVPAVEDCIEARTADGTVKWAGIIGGKLREPPRVLAIVDGESVPIEVAREDMEWDAKGGKGHGTWFVTEE